MREACLRHDTGNRLNAGDIAARQHQRRRAVGDGRRIRRRHRAVLGKGRLERRDFRGVRLARLFVERNLHLTAARGNLHRNDLIGERSIVLRPLGAHQGFRRIGVLLLAGELVMPRGILGIRTHQPMLVSILKPVEEHVILDLAMTEPIPAARLGQKIRRVRHALHAARHRHVGTAKRQLVHRDHDRLHAGAADFAHGRGGDMIGHPGIARGLTCRRLAHASGQHAAHQNFLDSARVHASARNGGGNRGGAKLRPAQGRKLALESAHGRAGGGKNEHFR